MSVLRNLLVFTLITGGFSFHEDIPISELPSRIVDEIIDILTGTFEFLGKCDAPTSPDVALLLYTRNNPNDPLILDVNNITEIDSSKKLIVLLHGWLAEGNGTGITSIKDAYLARYDYNVISFDWSKIAEQLYTNIYCQLRTVATLGAEVLCRLSEQRDIPLNGVHLVGHSLGAHLSGFIGKNVKKMCNQTLGRITGLDPAGPLYQGASSAKRLDKSDALFVDVIHTHELVFGYWGNIGHIDYHINNCGIVLQPGCPTIDIFDIIGSILSSVGCSHSRSVEVMAESIISTEFIASTCEMCPAVCIRNMFPPEYIIMGQDYSGNTSVHKSYWVPTTYKAPYAIGCALFPVSCPKNL